MTATIVVDGPLGIAQHYFELVEQGPHTEPERLAMLEDHRREVLGRLVDLQAALETIELKIAMYGGRLGDALAGAGGDPHEQPVPVSEGPNR